jgi:hypothetical protein
VAELKRSAEEDMSPDFLKLYGKLKLLGSIAVLGVLLLVFSLVHGSEDGIGEILMILGVLAILPAFLLAYCMTILHWKHRYVGKKSTLWGVLLLLETSGWFKILYLFRHILPDIRGTGRYQSEKKPISEGSVSPERETGPRLNKPID